jgi:hypothetical protein
MCNPMGDGSGFASACTREHNYRPSNRSCYCVLLWVQL